MFLHAHSTDGLQAEDVLQIAQLADPSKEIVAVLSAEIDHICTNLLVETSHKQQSPLRVPRENTRACGFHCTNMCLHSSLLLASLHMPHFAPGMPLQMNQSMEISCRPYLFLLIISVPLGFFRFKILDCASAKFLSNG
jgi:hypothetical protein